MLEEELLRDQELFLDFERDQEFPEPLEDCELLLDLDIPFFPCPRPSPLPFILLFGLHAYFLRD